MADLPGCLWDGVQALIQQRDDTRLCPPFCASLQQTSWYPQLYRMTRLSVSAEVPPRITASNTAFAVMHLEHVAGDSRRCNCPAAERSTLGCCL